MRGGYDLCLRGSIPSAFFEHRSPKNKCDPCPRVIYSLNDLACEPLPAYFLMTASFFISTVRTELSSKTPWLAHASKQP